jgi:hypothetical protein
MADKEKDSVTPLEGKTSVDAQMFFEPEALSYLSAVTVAEQIASALLTDINGKNVVIAGERLLADFTNLQAILIRLDSLHYDYESIAQLAEDVRTTRSEEAKAAAADMNLLVPAAALETTISAAINPIGAALNAAIGLVSLFREDVEYRGIKTVIDSLAFEIALAESIKKHCATAVFIPDLMILNEPLTAEGSLSDGLNKVQQAKTDAWTVVGPLVAELVELEANLDLASRNNGQELVNALTLQISKLRRDMQPISDPLSRADRMLSELQNQLVEPDETKISMLARLLRAEVIRSTQPIYIHAKVVSSGGHHRISRNLFRMLFLGDGLSFAGGVIVRWALLLESGAVEKGGLCVERRKSSTWSMFFNKDKPPDTKRKSNVSVDPLSLNQTDV